MVSAIISRLVILVFGTLYPAYASYKAVKTKNVKEYVKWMMYWIVFAFFTCAETFSDIFLAWIPFYYELKMIFVIWLLSPATKGASILYRKFVHPQLAKREKDIDAYINKASDQGYTALLSLGSKGFNYATNVVLATAIKGQSKIVDQLKKSYSMNDLTPESLAQPRRPLSLEDSNIDDETDNRILEENYQQEMMELEDADREKEYKRSLSSGLSRVEETEEENIQTRSASNKNRYSSKEESYYTTYYRGTSSTTPTSTWQTSTSTSPTSWRSTYSSYYK